MDLKRRELSITSSFKIFVYGFCGLMKVCSTSESCNVVLKERRCRISKPSPDVPKCFYIFIILHWYTYNKCCYNFVSVGCTLDIFTTKNPKMEAKGVSLVELKKKPQLSLFLSIFAADSGFLYYSRYIDLGF